MRAVVGRVDDDGVVGDAEIVERLQQLADMAVELRAAELLVLEGYLPQRLSATEIDAAVAAIVTELGAAGPGDMGKVMGAVKSRLAGKADMGLVSAAVKQALNR